MEKQEIIKIIYTAFNNRDIDAVLTHFHPDVEWPKAFEGSYVQGRQAVADYWTRQWGEIDPKVIPVEIIEAVDGEVCVTVKQLVKDLTGTILFDGTVNHNYTFKDGLVRKMNIGE